MEITSEELKRKIENGDKIIVDFFADWCLPCKRMKPLFEKVSEETIRENIGVQLYTFNVESDTDFSVKLGIRSVPTIKSFSNGVEVYSKSGLQMEQQIKDIVKTLLNG